jgi:N-acetylglucosamine-6-phosphate deacetylase
MSNKRIIIEAQRVYTPFEELQNAVVELEGSRILRVGNAEGLPSGTPVKLKCYALGPGFIDVQVNGAGGVDAARVEDNGLNSISTLLARFGVTGFLPTVITALEPDLMQSLDMLSAAMDRPVQGAQPLGIHLEGPFLNPVKKGAHPLNAIRLPSVDFFKKLHHAARGRIVYLTLAPELPGGLDLITQAREKMGIPILSMGHSDATYQQAVDGMHAGCRFATHTFNAMHEFHQREPGLLALILNEPAMRASIIADGIHVHPALVKLFLKTKSASRAVLTTDSISAAGMPEGVHRLGTMTVEVKDGICRNSEGTLAGSTLTMDRAARNAQEWSGMSWSEIFQMSSYNPADALGAGGRKGTISAGADADLVLMNEHMEVERTVVAGRIVYEKAPRAK